MSFRNRSARLATTLAALVLLPALARAENKDRSVEVGATFSFIRFDTQSSLDNRFGPSVMAGYNFTKRHGAEIVFTSTTATPDENFTVPVDVDILRVGYTFNAYPRERIVPFFRFGLGIWAIDPEEDPKATDRLDGSDTNFMVYSGGGFRYFLADRFGLRFDVTVDFIDAGDGLPNADVEATGQVGVIFLLGGVEPPAGPTEEVSPE